LAAELMADEEHEKQMLAAFDLVQAQQCAAADRCVSLFMTTLLMLVLWTVSRRSALQLSASLFSAAAMLAPGAFSSIACTWYVPRRTWIVATSRLTTVVALGFAVPPNALPAVQKPGLLHFLAVIRVFSLPMLAYSFRLPVKVRCRKRRAVGSSSHAHSMLSAMTLPLPNTMHVPAFACSGWPWCTFLVLQRQPASPSAWCAICPTSAAQQCRCARSPPWHLHCASGRPSPSWCHPVGCMPLNLEWCCQGH
jgi:hypothetical protein